MTDQNRKSLGSILLSLVLGIAVGTAAHATLRSESNKWADGVSAAAGVSTSASAYALLSAKRKRKDNADTTATQSCCEQTVEPPVLTVEAPVLTVDAPSAAGIALQEPVSDSESAVASEFAETASEATENEILVSTELDIAPSDMAPAAITQGLATEESEQVSKTALPQLCQESTRDDANEGGFTNEAGYSASRNDAEGEDFDIRIGLPVLSRSQYRRATGVPQRLKSIEGIVWSNTTMLDDGRRIMEGTFAADSNTENIWNLVLSTLGVQRS